MSSHKITVIAWAAARDFFEGRFELEIAQGATIKDISKQLTEMNPAAAELLGSCRWACGDDLADQAREVAFGEVVSVLPPSSGG